MNHHLSAAEVNDDDVYVMANDYPCRVLRKMASSDPLARKFLKFPPGDGTTVLRGSVVKQYVNKGLLIEVPR